MGQVYFAPNVGTHSAPDFTGYEALEADGSPIDVGARARECIDDWNEDGIPDLVVGNTTNDKIQIFLGFDTGIEDQGTAPVPGAASMGIAGNPTYGLFMIGVQLPVAGPVDIQVRGAEGRTVRGFSRFLPAGYSGLSCDIGDNPAGVYFVSVEFGTEMLTERVVLLR